MLDVEALSEMMAGIIAEEVAKEIAPLKAEIAELKARPIAEPVDVVQLVQDEVAKIPAPENGKDADPEQVASLVAETVERAVAALPAPQDGKSVGVEDVAPLIEAEVGKAVAALPVPRSLVGVIVNREGEAVYTYSDGSTENIGKVVGRDGLNADMATLEKRIDEQVAEKVALIPTPKDGLNGFSLDDFDCVPVDERTLELQFTQGDRKETFELVFPVVIDRGVFKADENYQRGDAVTWGGSLWIAQKDSPPGKPDSPDSGWRLAVKKGRDGKDAKNG